MGLEPPTRIPLRNGDEFDALCVRCRRILTWTKRPCACRATPGTTDWSARRAAVAAADDDDWDRLSGAFDADWKSAYSVAFVENAVSRGWSRDNAESWPGEIACEALLSAAVHDFCPRRTAEADVIACELERADA